MERLTLAFQRADQALHSLLEALALKGRTDIERDAAIQRFAFTS